MIRRETSLIALSVALPALLAAGCMLPETPAAGVQPLPTSPTAAGKGQWPLFTQVMSKQAPALPQDDPNIIGVRKFIMQEPWLSFSPAGIRQIDGFKATLYLESGTTGKGAFGDGNIRVSLYTVERDASGEHLRLAVQWELTPEQSGPWRAKSQTRLGWGYGLRLPWGDADLSGKEIELIFQFIRRDGAIVSSEPMRLRVPLRSVRLVTRDDAPGRPAGALPGPQPSGVRSEAPKSLAAGP